jgi:hypothetical protein
MLSGKKNLHESLTYQRTHSEERHRTSTRLHVVVYVVAVHVTNLSVAQTTQYQMVRRPVPDGKGYGRNLPWPTLRQACTNPGDILTYLLHGAESFLRS